MLAQLGERERERQRKRENLNAIFIEDNGSIKPEIIKLKFLLNLKEIKIFMLLLLTVLK